MQIPFSSIIVLGAIILFIYIFNRLALKRNTVYHALAAVNVYLKMRLDLVAELIAATSDCLKTQTESLSQLAEMRANSASITEKSVLDMKLTAALRDFMAQLDSCPDLKSSDSIADLQNSISKIEKQLASARIKYNNSAADYNNALKIFPASLFAALLQFKKFDLFEIPPEV